MSEAPAAPYAAGVTQSKADTTGRIRAPYYTGGHHGPRHPAVVIGGTYSDNHPARADLALIEQFTSGERKW